jgi:hypothetical protein
MRYPVRFTIAVPSVFRLGGSHDNVAVPIPGDDRLGCTVSIGVGARRLHAHRVNKTAIMQIVACLAMLGRLDLMMTRPAESGASVNGCTLRANPAPSAAAGAKYQVCFVGNPIALKAHSQPSGIFAVIAWKVACLLIISRAHKGISISRTTQLVAPRNRPV